MLYNVKAGIMGLDDLGVRYAKLLKDHVKNISLIAASGRSQKELMYAKSSLSLEYVYGDEKQLIENHDIDAIFILSDLHLKADHSIQAIEKGKHVFLINPIALNLEDARAINKSADSHPSQRVMCASPVKGNNVLRTLKRIIDEGELGDLQYMQLDSSFVQSMNKRFAKASGSKYLDGLLDEIELFQWLCPKRIERVEIDKKSGFKICNAFTEDSLCAQFMMREEGAIQGVVRIEGTRARVILDNTNASYVDLYYHDGTRKSFSASDQDGFHFSEYLQLHHFTNCVLGKEKNTLGLKSAVDSMELALAFEKADVLNSSVSIEIL